MCMEEQIVSCVIETKQVVTRASQEDWKILESLSTIQSLFWAL
jgi:hypothetical protein